MERRKFTREFKLEAVKLIRERGVSVAQASHDLCVHRRSCAIGQRSLRRIRSIPSPAMGR